jgi:hypothetical protein
MARSANHQTLIDVNLQAVLDNTVPDGDADKVSQLTNRLAILVAAIVICKS